MISEKASLLFYKLVFIIKIKYEPSREDFVQYFVDVKI